MNRLYVHLAILCISAIGVTVWCVGLTNLIALDSFTKIANSVMVVSIIATGIWLVLFVWSAMHTIRMLKDLSDKEKSGNRIELGEVPPGTTVTAETVEQMIQAKGLTAPRVTLDDLNANIVGTDFVKYTSRTGQVLRWAILTTQNGFAVVGKPSVSVSPENDNQEIGEKIAVENSRNELWPLMGYALKDRLIPSGNVAAG